MGFEKEGAVVGLKMCIMKFVPCYFTSHLPSANDDVNALGNRCAIYTPIVYRCPHERALLPHLLSTPHHQQVSGV